MKQLTKYLTEQILLEDSNIKTIVAIYPGRFQPMGAHHAKTFKWLQSKFKNAYVGTSGKVDLPKSPMLTPVRIISFAPLSIAFLASINVLSIEAFLLRPRAKGMVQNEQK